jgi:hypothetical protein
MGPVSIHIWYDAIQLLKGLFLQACPSISDLGA